MTIDRRTLLLAALASGVAVRAQGQSETDIAGPDETIELWPGDAPGLPAAPPSETIVERSRDPALRDRAITGITTPRLDVFRPEIPNGGAVMVTPGGAYQRVVIDKEGYEIGRWLSARGYTVFVLFYRLPGDGWAAGPNVALSDAQRAMRLIRRRASDFDLDPERVAAMGFSAGGHVSTDLVARYAATTYDPVDAADDLSARPLLAAHIYPVVSMSRPVTHEVSRAELLGEAAGPDLERAHSPQHNLDDNAPPCFLVHAEDDQSVDVDNTLAFRAALKAKDIPVECHLFTHGGHGFGLRGAEGLPVAVWPELFQNWADAMGLA
jgi:acetyl esterase/lipase